MNARALLPLIGFALLPGVATAGDPTGPLAAGEVRLIRDHDPPNSPRGTFPFYADPETGWRCPPAETFELDGTRVLAIAPERPAPGNPWVLERGFGEPLQVARASSGRASTSFRWRSTISGRRSSSPGGTPSGTT